MISASEVFFHSKSERKSNKIEGWDIDNDFHDTGETNYLKSISNTMQIMKQNKNKQIKKNQNLKDPLVGGRDWKSRTMVDLGEAGQFSKQNQNQSQNQINLQQIQKEMVKINMQTVVNSIKMELTDEKEKQILENKNKFYQGKEQKFLMRVTHLKNFYLNDSNKISFNLNEQKKRSLRSQTYHSENSQPDKKFLNGEDQGENNFQQIEKEQNKPIGKYSCFQYPYKQISGDLINSILNKNNKKIQNNHKKILLTDQSDNENTNFNLQSIYDKIQRPSSEQQNSRKEKMTIKHKRLTDQILRNVDNPSDIGQVLCKIANFQEPYKFQKLKQEIKNENIKTNKQTNTILNTSPQKRQITKLKKEANSHQYLKNSFDQIQSLKLLKNITRENLNSVQNLQPKNYQYSNYNNFNHISQYKKHNQTTNLKSNNQKNLFQYAENNLISDNSNKTKINLYSDNLMFFKDYKNKPSYLIE